MAAVAAPALDWSGLTTYRDAVPVSPIANVVVPPATYNPVSKADDNLCPVGGGGGGSGPYGYPIGG